MSLFVEEIVSSFKETGKINSSFPKDKIKELIYLSMKNTNRFNGLTKEPYNLFKHCFFVGLLASDLAKIELSSSNKSSDYIAEMAHNSCIAGMCHDMAECIIGDIVYPIKNGFIENEYKKLEDFEYAVRKYFWNEVFEFGNFDDVYLKTKDFVKTADYFAGTMELIGVSETAAFSTTMAFRKALDFNMNFEDEFDTAFRTYREALKKEKKK